MLFRTHRMRDHRSGKFHMETSSSDLGVLSQLLRSFEDADIYLRFSVVGVVVFCILCCLICCAWSRYGSVISSLFDPQS